MLRRTDGHKINETFLFGGARLLIYLASVSGQLGERTALQRHALG